MLWFVRQGPSASSGLRISVSYGWVLRVGNEHRRERVNSKAAANTHATINKNEVGYRKFLYFMLLPLDLI